MLSLGAIAYVLGDGMSDDLMLQETGFEVGHVAHARSAYAPPVESQVISSLDCGDDTVVF